MAAGTDYDLETIRRSYIDSFAPRRTATAIDLRREVNKIRGVGEGVCSYCGKKGTVMTIHGVSACNKRRSKCYKLLSKQEGPPPISEIKWETGSMGSF